jgi:hypothetical protein
MHIRTFLFAHFTRIFAHFRTHFRTISLALTLESPLPSASAFRSVRWVLAANELFTPTGAPQTAAGRAALQRSAPKPTLRRDTPLSARVAASAARAQAQQQAQRSGGGSGGKPKQRTPHGGGGGGAGGAAGGTPGSAARPRAVDFF